MASPNSHPDGYERGDPWFEDGNIILLTNEPCIAFKVHRGVLARHSEIFQSMFELPPMTTGPNAEVLEGCPFVRMYDPPAELSSLIKTLYDYTAFQNRNATDFFHVAGVLKLATKYIIARLRSHAIRFLAETWSSTLQGHDRMIELALRAPPVDGLSFPYVHPLHVLSLAREVDAPVLIPSAVYFLSLYPLTDILRGDHPKLKIEHPSRPPNQLSPLDIQDYTLMYQHRIDAILGLVRTTCGARTVSPGCTGNVCMKAFAKLSALLSRSWFVRTGPLHFMLQALDEVDNDGSLCAQCRRAFKKDVTAARQKLWDGLPGVIGLPSWDDLESDYMPPRSS
ncbi:hypothetical protein WOLCODRAFT_68391 [Wolfiporia cocos MD-104 SS10]|uniref:BTB domain-containing protein n=1 Tax=Wolfiporia cocos (strain MD-104) TaxID=742152 RepID=A0A2H3JDZ7_WOLCO|nr:hypothetical protein WOLCODRAFT_68391 [Wolfiporia cocos MD-104 SS10]